jgi:hypothetical protein
MLLAHVSTSKGFRRLAPPVPQRQQKQVAKTSFSNNSPIAAPWVRYGRIRFGGKVVPPHQFLIGQDSVPHKK